MKIYTEEQVRKAISYARSISADNYENPPIERVLNSITPIELPSDGEIAYEAVTWNVYNMTQLEAFRHGVNWTKEQILNQNK